MASSILHSFTLQRLSAVLVCGIALFSASCLKPKKKPQPLTTRVLATAEMHSWLDQATERFNKSKAKLSGGAPLQAEVIYSSSENITGKAVDPEVNAHALCPSASWMLSDASLRDRELGNPDSFLEPVSIARTPLVFVTWKRIAERMGWTESGLGWRDVASISSESTLYREGTTGVPFRLAFPDPISTNTGLITLLSLATVAGGQTEGPSEITLRSPAAAAMLWNFEFSLAGYASSPGALMESLIETGPELLTLAVVYEHQTLLARGSKRGEPVTVLFPREGTWVADHPFALINRPWVDAPRREGAKRFLAHLLSDKEQHEAEKLGIRPAGRSPRPDSPFNPPDGLDPAEPNTLDLQPSAPINSLARGLWQQSRRPTRTIILLDTSASMRSRKPSRLAIAERFIRELTDALPANDQIGLVTFSDTPVWQVPLSLPGTARVTIEKTLRNIKPSGGSALFDAIRTIYTELRATTKQGAPTSLVVLSDGGDFQSRVSLNGLTRELTALQTNPQLIRIHACSFDGLSGLDTLRRLALTTGGRAFALSSENTATIAKELTDWF